MGAEKDVLKDMTEDLQRRVFVLEDELRALRRQLVNTQDRLRALSDTQAETKFDLEDKRIREMLIKRGREP